MATLFPMNKLEMPIRDSYSVEFWVKPSHYHLGSVVSLVGDTPMESGIIAARHADRTGRQRQRSPRRFITRAAFDFCIATRPAKRLARLAIRRTHTRCESGNTSWRPKTARRCGCTSTASSLPRAPIKARSRRACGYWSAACTQRAAIGRSTGSWMSLALYDRALGESEITQHYQLVRPAVADPSSI